MTVGQHRSHVPVTAAVPLGTPAARPATPEPV